MLIAGNKGYLASLEGALTKQGRSASDIEHLSTLLKAEEAPAAREKLGPKVSAWLGQMAFKVAEGTLTAGGTLALKAISNT